MPGFGKKNARGHDLRAVMIYAAAEIFEKEKESRRLLRKDEMQDIVNLVCKARNVQPSRVEFSSAVVGTKRLSSNRAFVDSLATRWSNGPIKLKDSDLKRAREILESTNAESAHLRPLV